MYVLFPVSTAFLLLNANVNMSAGGGVHCKVQVQRHQVEVITKHLYNIEFVVFQSRKTNNV